MKWPSLILLIMVSFILLAVYSGREENSSKYNETKEMIVLRKVVHELLLSSGDSTSRVLPVKQISENEFHLFPENPLSIQPDSLVQIISKTIKEGKLLRNFTASVVKCQDKEVVYGLVSSPAANENVVSCLGRELPADRYYLDFIFSPKEKTQLKQYANRILLKNVNSLEMLLEEAVMHLHLNHKELLPEKRRMIENLRLREDVLANKTILVVDDDVRNLFALTTAFERHNIKTITAESGQEAINILSENLAVDMVLMDIMMPEMDGYETTQKIRREHKNSNLPIIAVTAKAMKGDREKCIEAGASDYITKPVKIDQLLSLMRVWLYK